MISEKSEEIFKVLLVSILSSLIFTGIVDLVEAVPIEWTFTGYAEVEDPLGNPIANAPVFMEGSTRYNIRQERDPETGEMYWAWDTAYCSASGASDSQGQAMLSCSIPWEQAEEADSQRMWIDPCYNELEHQELSRDHQRRLQKMTSMWEVFPFCFLIPIC